MTFGDAILSDRTLAVLRCCGNSGSRESTGALLSCIKQPSDYPIDSLRSVWSVLTALLALLHELTSCPVFVSVMSSICQRSSCEDEWQSMTSHNIRCRLVPFSLQSSHRLLPGCYGNPGSREIAVALLPRTKQPSAGAAATHQKYRDSSVLGAGRTAV